MIRCILIVVSLCLALPLLVTFDSLLMWKVTLVAGEYGHRLALLPLLTALWSWRCRGWKGLISCAICAGVLLSPLITATVISRRLPAELLAAFPAARLPVDAPLDGADLWLGGAVSATRSQTILLPSSEGVPSRRLLFYPPARGGKHAPCILSIHGGGWENGEAEDFAEVDAYWTSQDYAVVSLDYRLAPRWTWPAQRDDVRDALAYLKAHSAELGLDPARFVLLGRSAGGQIATAAAYSLNDPAVRGCISLYGPADMQFAWDFSDPQDVLDSPKLIRQYLGGMPAEVPENYLTSSATLLAHSGCPPTLMVHGRQDILVWHLQSRRLQARLRTVGVPSYFLDLPWATHGLDYPLHGPGAQLSRYATAAFLSSVMGPGRDGPPTHRGK